MIPARVVVASVNVKVHLPMMYFSMNKQVIKNVQKVRQIPWVLLAFATAHQFCLCLCSHLLAMQSHEVGQLTTKAGREIPRGASANQAALHTGGNQGTSELAMDPGKMLGSLNLSSVLRNGKPPCAPRKTCKIQKNVQTSAIEIVTVTCLNMIRWVACAPSSQTIKAQRACSFLIRLIRLCVDTGP